MTSDPIDLAANRRERDRQKLSDAILQDLGIDADGIAALVDGAPPQIRDALIASVTRQQHYREIDHQHAAADEAEGIPADRCCNMVCPNYVQFDGFEERDGRLIPIGVPNRCKGGAEEAQGCMFRMVDRPPSDPFRRLPSHAEALRMLMRAGLLEPDEFGHWNGTDFAAREATSRLWWAYVNLLLETGRIAVADEGEAANKALATLGYPRHCPEYLWCVDTMEPSETQYHGPWTSMDDANAALAEALAEGLEHAVVAPCSRVAGKHVGLSAWRLTEEADERLRESPPGHAWANWETVLVKLRDPKTAQAELDAWAERNLEISCYLPVGYEGT